MKTVILLYPDYMNESGNPVETFVQAVDTKTVEDAIRIAKMSCQKACDGNPEDLDHLAVLAVIHGCPDMEMMM